MEFKDYVRIVLAHWVGVLVLILVGIGAAAVYNTTQPAVYQASASGIVSLGKTSTATEASIADNLARSKVTSYAAIATSTETADQVVTDIKANAGGTDPVYSKLQSLGTNGLVGKISVTQPIDTALITINARDTDPATATALATAWVRALSEQVSRLESVPLTKQRGLRVLPYGSSAGASQVLPRTTLNLLIGLLFGMLLGFAYAMVRHQFDRRLRSSEEVEKKFGVPVIGLVPQSSHMRHDDSRALTLAVTGSNSAASASTAEAFRKLRTNLAYMDVDKPPRIIVVTSPKQSDGKSTIAANLAAAIAIGGQPITLIDGDLRRPTVADSLAIVDGAGLTDVLVGRVKVEEVMQDHPDVPGLRVLASGAIPPNPSELLGSQAMRHLIADLSKDAMVIIDAPPLLPVTDAAVLTRSADGAIVVISHGGTLDTELQAALNNITTVHGRTLGIVFNRMRRRASGGYYGDYYRYEYQADHGKRRLKPRAKRAASAGSQAPIEDTPTSGAHPAPRS
jgi:capsular exopolysaccharide synthesis family protein